MWEFIIKELWVEIFRIIVISLGTLGVVYIGGRLLELVRSDHQKNVLAFVSLFGISYCISVVKFPRDKVIDTLWDVSIYAVISAVPYVILWWRLFDRADTFLDGKGLRDKKRYKDPKPKRKKRRK